VAPFVRTSSSEIAMSVVNARRRKILLRRGELDEFWDAVFHHFAGDDPPTWRNLAILALHVTAGFSLERIALTFGVPRGHVSRSLRRVKAELRKRFTLDPDEAEVDRLPEIDPVPPPVDDDPEATEPAAPAT
jgi:hypothetical protein